ncbi:MAG: hypothetical protein ACOYYJ_02200 [Chloroflexota bacterium]
MPSPLSRFFLSLGLLAVLLAACMPQNESPPAPAFPDANATRNAPTETAVPTPTRTKTPVPRTPPALPQPFTMAPSLASDILHPLDAPHAYIDDTCQYLRDKWTPGNAAPGTIVIIIMFRGIVKGETGDPTAISAKNFSRIVKALHEQGFQAITAAQLADFLDHNAAIPPRSALLLVDDRRQADYFDSHFRPLYEGWGWPVVNAWASAEDGTRTVTLSGNMALASEGWVDYQTQAPSHTNKKVSPETIASEFEASRDDLQQNFDARPVAVIWPDSGFDLQSVEIAREYEYRLGFTSNPRGPVMYNWVPLTDQEDPKRPNYFPEGQINDPRMTLPRYWPYQVLDKLDPIRALGNEAREYAEQNKAVELEYYDIVCAPTYGPLPVAP